MSTIWKTTETNRNKFTGQLSCWSRQQKLAIIASLVMLGILLAVSACSKQSQAPTTGGVSASAPNSLAAPAPAPPQRAAAASPSILTATKKSPKKRPATVTYKDAATGVSFVYPRKFVLATGEKARPRFDDNAVPMNFTQSGGATVATVALPKSLYPGTDFATGFFSVNVNQGLAEEECSHFAFVDVSNQDGEPVDAEKVKVGLNELEMTSEFVGSVTRQAEAQYYHQYENGVCYEYVLGLGTAGFGTSDGVEPVDRDQIFAQLKKILATAKIHPVTSEQGTEQAAGTGESAK